MTPHHPASTGEPPTAGPVLEQLTLAELRDYRGRLRREEERVSYWRRLVHARTDLLEAGRSTDGSLSLPALVRALGDTGTGASRSALLRVRAQEPLPDVPALAEVWTSPSDPEETLAVLTRLRVAEDQLTRYRRALFARLDASTEELIARYRAEPGLALSAMS